MAAEDTFRPRKPINPTEFETGAESLQEGLAVRQAAAAEVGNQFNEPMVDGGIKMTGNTEILKKVLEARREQPQQQQQQQQQPQATVPQPRQPRITNESSDMRARGSDKLKGLIDGLAPVYRYHEIKLPSLGKFYDGEDGPQDGILHIRSMTGEEEQILATQRLVRKGQAINMIFDSCLQEKNFKSERFLSPDRTYLLIFLRGLSYTREYDVEVRCTECGTKFATIIDLDRLNVDECPIDFDQNSLTGFLPDSGYRYTYRIARGIDEQKLQDYRERKMKFDSAGLPDDTLLYRTAMLIEDIEGLTDKAEIQILLKRLGGTDLSHLRNVVNDQPFGVDTNVGISCQNCLRDFTVELPLEASFFFPRNRKASTTPV